MAQVIQLQEHRDNYAGEMIRHLLNQIDELNRKVSGLELQLYRRMPVKSSIWINLREGVTQVILDNVSHCAAEGNYTYIFFDDGKKILASLTLKAIESMFSDNRFVRVHKSYLVNKHKIATISSSDDNSVQLLNNIEIPVSRRRRSTVKTLCR